MIVSLLYSNTNDCILRKPFSLANISLCFQVLFFFKNSFESLIDGLVGGWYFMSYQPLLVI